VETLLSPDELKQDYVCVSYVPAGEGDHCGFDYPPAPYGLCEPGAELQCTGTCQPWAKLGEPCGGNVECIEGALCAFDATLSGWFCMPEPATGSPCFEGVCDERDFCDAAGICQERGGLGAPCSADVECLSDDCTNGICKSSTVSAECE